MRGAERFLHWVGNAWIPPAAGVFFPTVNPATGEVLAEVAAGDAADVDRAVQAARGAFRSPGWRRMSPHKRAHLLWKWAEVVEAHADELAELQTRDNGKPYFESRQVDLPALLENIRFFAGVATRVEGRTFPVKGPHLNYTLREPLGVVAAITPWNFPLTTVGWKVAPALACGNTVVLKPAEETPLTALRLAELAAEAGFPPGVLNVVSGMGESAGASLVAHPGVDAVSFTGSTEVGRIILRESAHTLKKVSLELGGKSPNLVFADADLEAAVRGASTGIFYGMGEVCAAGSRILVERTVYEPFLEGLLERARKMTVGDPMLPTTRLGALVSEAHLERVLAYVRSGREEGARLLTGGERTTVDGRGWFLPATVFADVEPTMRIAREEIFGPVAVVTPFQDLDEAVALANDTPYGLAAGVWTRDVGKAHRVARLLEAGTVWVNTYNQYDSTSPFGGYKESGFGRDLGAEAALEKYTQVKSVWVAEDR